MNFVWEPRAQFYDVRQSSRCPPAWPDPRGRASPRRQRFLPPQKKKMADGVSVGVWVSEKGGFYFNFKCLSDTHQVGRLLQMVDPMGIMRLRCKPMHIFLWSFYVEFTSPDSCYGMSADSNPSTH